MTPPRLYLGHDTDLDWLMAFEFGRIDDGQPPDRWRGVSERFGFLQDAPDGRVVGFKVLEFSDFDPEDPEVADIWGEPRFDVPVLGLVNAAAGEIVLAARAFFDGRDSLNRTLFGAASRASGEEAVALWRQCLESGDAMAHFALGYTLFELGRHAEAYRHLRHYTEIAPHGAWNWCWYGYVAEAVGELAEARRAYRRAIELEDAVGQETDAAECLAGIGATASLDTPAESGETQTASTTGRNQESEAPSAGERVRGCFLGGAVGDALGAPVEFDSIERIRRRFGAEGPADLSGADGRVGAITDDTQMTLFTAEGLIRAEVRSVNKGICNPVSVVDRAYFRWLATQGERSRRWSDEIHDGWLIAVPGLHERRAPGNTCLTALRSPRAGTVDAPLNDSKGCGGVMRIAPVGLLDQAVGHAFDLGCRVAALTHGHPSGYLAAGALAERGARVRPGEPMERGLNEVERLLGGRPRHEETVGALREARALAASAEPSGPGTIAMLGEGWVAEEALAISVYCALVAEDFEHGVRLAVNHSGDSDSTGAITGNILGVRLGAASIPKRWVDQVELREVVESLASDWLACFGTSPTADLESEEWWQRYPGW